MSTTIVTALVLAAGTVDRAATLAKFETDLDREIASRENDHERIGEAMQIVFAKFKGAKVNLPALSSYILQELQVAPTAWGEMDKRVKDYVRSVSKGDDALVSMAKGRDGGCRLIADLPAEETKPATK